MERDQSEDDDGTDAANAAVAGLAWVSTTSKATCTGRVELAFRIADSVEVCVLLAGAAGKSAGRAEVDADPEDVEEDVRVEDDHGRRGLDAGRGGGFRCAESIRLSRLGWVGLSWGEGREGEGRESEGG